MGKLLIKSSSVKPYTLTLLAAVANVAQLLSWDVTITSGNDSKHMKGSKHYTDEAIDVRSKNFPTAQAKSEFISAVLLRLGPGHDMFLENPGKESEHFHLERDPQ